MVWSLRFQHAFSLPCNGPSLPALNSASSVPDLTIIPVLETSAGIQGAERFCYKTLKGACPHVRYTWTKETSIWLPYLIDLILKAASSASFLEEKLRLAEALTKQQDSVKWAEERPVHLFCSCHLLN